MVGTCAKGDNSLSLWEEIGLVIVTILLALLDFKTPILWSESRVLRKLRKHAEWPEDEPVEILNCSVLNRCRLPHKKKFHIAYAKLSKGRHNLSSRLYSIILESWWLLLGWLAFFKRPFFVMKLFLFEPLVVFQIKIFSASFAIFGAWPPPVSRGGVRRVVNEYLVLFLCFGGLISIQYLILFAINSRTSALPERFILIVRLLTLSISTCYIGFQLLEWFIEPSIARVVSKMLRNREQVLKPREERLLNYYRTMAFSDNRFWVPSRLQIVKIICFIFFFISISLMDAVQAKKYFQGHGTLTANSSQAIATEIVLTSLESLSIVLWFVQETQVEPELFRTLIRQEMEAEWQKN